MKTILAFTSGILLAASTIISNADQQDDFDGGKQAAFERIMERNKARLSAMAGDRSRRSAEANIDRDSSRDHVSGRCVNGMAAGLYPCDGIDMLSHVDLDELGVTFVNDMWGHRDGRTGHEYALVGATEGTVAVDVTKPRKPKVVGMLPAAALDPDAPFWRDLKVYKKHAFIVSEQLNHGMQVMDLRQLRQYIYASKPVILEQVAQYDKFSTSHNIAINKSTAFAYVVGADTCLGGLEMIDIADPQNPTDAGCFSEHGYIHDAQCVTYRGPDREHRGREICFNASANPGDTSPFFNTLSIVDVSDKENIHIISNTEYAEGFGYSHQGWLSSGSRYYLHNDELDEFFGSVDTTTTRIWDVSDLDNPKLIGESTNGATSIDHNMYTRSRYAFASNYTSGFRVFNIKRRNLSRGKLKEIAYFDMYPEDDAPTFDGGTWSNYPYFNKLNVIGVSSMDRGLFMLRIRPNRL